MTDNIENQIHLAEQRLRLAMIDSDVVALDDLLAPDLLFTNHLGQILTKQDDLAAHRTRAVTIDVLVPSETHVRLVGNTAVVSVRVHLAGSYLGQSSEADFRFTRVWAPNPRGAWHVIAGHSTIVAAG